MQEPKISILVVDDEGIIHESCGRILREEGYEVDAALNGQEGLQKLREKRYNLVLSDIKMPGMDGVETLELMKREFPDIMVVMFTGFSSVETARSSMKLGAFDYLPKPFTPGELLAVVQRALARDREVRQKGERESRFQELLTVIHATLNLREVLHILVTGAVKMFALKGCTISLLDRKKEFFRVCAASGLSDAYLQKGPVASDRYLSSILAGSTPESIADIAASLQSSHPFEAKQEGITAIYSFPLHLKKEVIGMMRLYCQEPRTFSPDDIDFLKGFVSQASIALENARTYDDVRERYEALKDDLWEWCEYDSHKL